MNMYAQCFYYTIVNSPDDDTLSAREERQERLAKIVSGWKQLSEAVTGKAIPFIRILMARVIEPVFPRRNNPRWRKGRWRAKS